MINFLKMNYYSFLSFSLIYNMTGFLEMWISRTGQRVNWEWYIRLDLEVRILLGASGTNEFNSPTSVLTYTNEQLRVSDYSKALKKSNHIVFPFALLPCPPFSPPPPCLFTCCLSALLSVVLILWRQRLTASLSLYYPLRHNLRKKENFFLANHTRGGQ